MAAKQHNDRDDERVSSSPSVTPQSPEGNTRAAAGLQRTGIYSTDVRTYDVLLGRGTGPSMNKGNIEFRETVEKLKASYIATPSRKVKKQIVRKIVQDIKAKQGRFLNKLTKNEIKMLGLSPKDLYEVVAEDVALEKTKQAIRYVHYKKDPATRKRSPSLGEIELPTKVLKRENYVGASDNSTGISDNPRQSFSPKLTPNMVSSPGLGSVVPPFSLSAASRFQAALTRSPHQQLMHSSPALAAYNPSMGSFFGNGLSFGSLPPAAGLHDRASLQRFSRGLPMASILSLSHFDPVLAEASLRFSRDPVLTEANFRLSRAMASMVAQREQLDAHTM